MIFEATATGCEFGLRAISGKEKGMPMSKAWHIKGTLPTITDYLHRTCQCRCRTVHATASGADTAHTGRYTPAFVASIHRMFALATKTDSYGNLPKRE